MKPNPLSRALIALSLAPLLSCLANNLQAAVTVGNSSLIGQLDYSDTFTFGTGASGTRFGNPYTAGAFPPPANVLPVENNYGNPARTWTGSRWSLNNDAVFLSGSLTYPGGSGAGSDSGFTQTGNAVDFGIEYDLRTNFVVQFDAVQVSDRIDITVSNARDSIAGANGLSVFFRTNGFTSGGNSAEIGLYSPSIGEVLTTLDTGLASVDLGEWHNYAVHFNLDTKQLGIYVDQIQLGTLDLATLGGPLFGSGNPITPGAFAGVITAVTNDAISVGGSGGNRVWTDNFQVGAPIPEPAAASLAGLAVLALLRRRRAA